MEVDQADMTTVESPTDGSAGRGWRVLKLEMEMAEEGEGSASFDWHSAIRLEG